MDSLHTLKENLWSGLLARMLPHAGHCTQRRTASKKPQLQRPKALLMVASQDARSTTSA